MTKAQRHFRRVMAHFPTGVTVVTSRDASGRPCGLTVNSFASVSLDPLLVLVCLDRQAQSLSCILDAGTFAVSVLSTESEPLARRFSHRRRGRRFEGVELRETSTGSPVLAQALAWVDCRVTTIHEAGDHVILLGEVVDCDARDGEPLVFFRGDYHRVRA